VKKSKKGREKLERTPSGKIVQSGGLGREGGGKIEEYVSRNHTHAQRERGVGRCVCFGKILIGDGGKMGDKHNRSGD